MEGLSPGPDRDELEKLRARVDDEILSDQTVGEAPELPDALKKKDDYVPTEKKNDTSADDLQKRGLI